MNKNTRKRGKWRSDWDVRGIYLWPGDGQRNLSMPWRLLGSLSTPQRGLEGLSVTQRLGFYIFCIIQRTNGSVGFKLTHFNKKVLYLRQMHFQIFNKYTNSKMSVSKEVNCLPIPGWQALYIQKIYNSVSCIQFNKMFYFKLS